MKKFTLLLALLLPFGWLYAQDYQLRTDFAQADDTVFAVTRANGNIYLGGSFSHLSYETGPGAVVNVSSGKPDLPFPRANGEVFCAVPDGAGGWYVGGAFTTIGGLPRGGAARIRADKTVDPDWAPNAVSGGGTPAVRAIVRVGENIFVGGQFDEIGGQPRANIAAVNNINGLALPWNPGVTGVVFSLSTDGINVYAGGSFTNAGGQARGNAAAWNTQTGDLLNWNPGFDNIVYDIIYHEDLGGVVAGGAFTTALGQPRNRIAVVTTDGTLGEFNPGADGIVFDLHVTGYAQTTMRLWAAGEFTVIGGEPRERAAELRPFEGNLPTEWSANADGAVNSIVEHNGIVFLGGAFQRVQGQERGRVAAVSLSTSELLNWNPNADNYANVISPVGDRLYIGGAFDRIGREERSNLAAISEATGLITDWNPSANGAVRALEANNNTIYAGGDFTRIGNDIRGYIAALDPVDGMVEAFNPNADGPVYALSFYEGLLYAGGAFSQIGAAERRSIAALQPSDSRATSWRPDTDEEGIVRVIALWDTVAYVGGRFEEIGGESRQNLAAISLNATRNNALEDWIANVFINDPARGVYDLEVDAENNRLYIGGNFAAVQAYDGTPGSGPLTDYGGFAHAIAVSLLDLDSDVVWARIDLDWNPLPDAPVYALEKPVIDGESEFVVLGGAFNTLNGGAAARGRLAQVDTAFGAANEWLSQIGNGEVYATHVSDFSLYAGGSFRNVNLAPRRYVAEYTICNTLVELRSDRNAGCPGASFNIESTPGGFGSFTFNWSPAAGLSSTTDRNVSANPTQTTTYTLAITDGRGCQAANEITLTIHPLPVADAGPDVEVCSNDTVRLAAEGGARYLWSPRTGLDTNTVARPFASPEVNTLYSVRVTSNAGCQATDNAAVTVLPLPEVAVTDTAKVCPEGDSVMVEATGGVAYAWTPNTGIGDTTSATPMVFPDVTTTYTVVVTGANGCQVTDSTIVEVGPGPVTTVSADVDICRLDSTMLEATGGNAYVWFPEEGLSDPFSAAPMASPDSTTTYSVFIEGDNCVILDSVTVNVDQGPEIILSPDTTVCLGLAVQLDANSSAPEPLNWSWTPNNERITNPDFRNPVVQPLETATWVVELTGANGCRNIDSILVEVLPLPEVTAGNDTVTCSGQGVGLSATGGPTVESYFWAPQEGLDNANTSDPIANPTEITTYTVTVQNEFGCEASDAVTVTVSESPEAVVPSNLVQICPGDTALLSAEGGEIYTWSPDIALSTPNNSETEAAPLFTTDYVVEVKNAQGCADFATVRVEVLEAPNVDAGMDTIVCPDGQLGGANLRAESATPGAFSWEPAFSVSNPNISNPIARPAETTTYTVTLTSDLNECQGTDEVTVFTHVVANVSAGSDVSICPGDTIDLRGRGGVTDTSYDWRSLDARFGQIVGDREVRYPDATLTSRENSVAFEMRAFDANGCYGADTVTLSPLEIPEINAGIDIQVCPGGSDTLQPIDVADAVAFTWSPSVGLSADFVRNPEVTPNATTTYTLEAELPNGCSAFDSVVVELLDLPNVSVTNDTLICQGAELQLNAEGGDQFVWEPARYLDDPNVRDPVATPEENITYTVTITDTENTRCSVEETVTVRIFENIDVPVTPQGPVELCRGEGTVVLRTPAKPLYVYQWFDEGDPIENANGPAYAADSSGSFTVQVSLADDPECAAESDEVAVFIYEKPVIDFEEEQVVICEGGSVTLQPQTIDNDYNYTWFVNGQEVQSGSDYEVSPDVTTVYRLNAVSFTDGCENNATIRVVVNPPVTPRISADGSTRICEGENVRLSSSAGPGYTYEWYRDDEVIDFGNGAPFIDVEEAGEYYVVLNIAGCEENTSNTLAVTVDPLPELSVIEEFTICSGFATELEAEGEGDFRWRPREGLNNPNIAGPLARPEETTTYTVMLTSENGCVSVDSSTVTVLEDEQLPAPELLPRTAWLACPEATLDVFSRLTTPIRPLNYQWRYENEILPDATSSELTLDTPGRYTLEVSSPYCGAARSDVREFAFRDTAIFVVKAFEPATCDTCADGFIQLRAAGGAPWENRSNNQRYQYSIDGGANFFFTRSFTNLNPGLYDIAIRDSAGCESYDTLRIESPTSRSDELLASSLTVYPNPNKGVFYLQAGTADAETYQIEVFDMAGKLMFKHSWDARSESRKTVDLSGVSSGVYILKVAGAKGTAFKKVIVE